MKKILVICFAALSAVLFAVSCKDAVEPLSEERTLENAVTFTAVIEQPSTRTVLDGTSVLWSTGDQIKVFTDNYPSGVVYDLVGGAGTSKGTFSGATIGSGPYYAVYPASAAVALSGTSVSVSLGDTQTYASGSFGSGANLSTAVASTLDALTFKNALGALALTISGSANVGSVSVATAGSELLNGTATLSGIADSNPTLSFAATQTATSNKRVTLDCGTAGVPLSASGTTFYIMLPPGALASGFYLEVADTDGKAMLRRSVTGNTDAIERSSIRPMPALAYQPDYKAAFLACSGAGAFSNAGPSDVAIKQCCLYTEGKSQYSYLTVSGKSGSRMIRLQDMEDGYALTFALPYTMTLGSTVTADITTLGNTGDISSANLVSLKVIKKTDNRAWLYDQATGNGYIVILED